MTAEKAFLDLAEAEDELAAAGLRFAAAYRDAASSDEATERMLLTRDALLEACDKFDAVEAAWFSAVEPADDEENDDA